MLSCLAECCLETCCKAGCVLCGEVLPPCVTNSFSLAVGITLLVVGILGASSIIQMEPAAAYLGLIVPGFMFSIISCVGLHLGRRI